MKSAQKRTSILFFIALTLLVAATVMYLPSPAQAAATDDFVITVKTDNPGPSSNTQFTIPTGGSGYNYNVDCNNDGTDEAVAQTGNYTCNYGAAGTYTVRIKDNSGAGTGFHRIYFNNGGDKDKLLTIEQWGTGQWSSMAYAFYGCTNLAGQASDAPDLSVVTNMYAMFAGAAAFNQNIGSWNTANITNMSFMFYNANAFNQNIGSWNTASVTDMSSMFYNANVFNQNIGSWDTTNVTNMSIMFYNANAFNQNIGSWNTTNVTNMGLMFYNANAFNQNIGSWNTAAVTNMANIFDHATVFNQNIGGWDTTNVTDMRVAFGDAAAFNQDISGWNTTNVTNMSSMFYNAAAFDQNIGSWNVGAVTDINSMFYNAAAFNQNIGSWNTANVTNMSSMFYNATAFNQNISSWNTANVTNMGWMFNNAAAFNQDIGGWNTTNVINMYAMFYNAAAFNQNIGGWNTTNVTNMYAMFYNAAAFNQNIGGWNTANVTNMYAMFTGAAAFDQDIGGWGVGAVTDANFMFLGATLSTANYDALLIGWNAQTLQNGVAFSGGASAYCLGENARANMGSSDSWIISDGGKNCGVVWDGGGGDNNWSTGANWVGDAVPSSTDTVFFDATSAKNAVIDVAFGGTVGSLLISDQYAGSISFSGPLAVTGGYIQDGGTVIVSPAITFIVDGAFTHSGGKLQETRTVSNANVAFLQILNSAANVQYRGVNVDTTTSAANLGDTTVTVRAVDIANGEYCTNTGAGSPAYAARCYTITPTTTGAATVRLWTLTNELNGIAEANLSVYHHTAPSTWAELTANRVMGNDGGRYSYGEGDTLSFSAFLLGGTGSTPTAVTLHSISATATTPILPLIMALVLLTAVGLIAIQQQRRNQ